MRIGVINGSNQKDKNKVLDSVLRNTLEKINKPYEIINFGVYEDEDIQLSYIQVAVAASILINSNAIDFVITGCSSGTGMMLACNSLPNIKCAYIPTPSDAYLFEEPFGIGYPKEEANKKKKDARLLDYLKRISQNRLIDILQQLDRKLIQEILQRQYYSNYLKENGEDKELLSFLETF